MLGEAIAPRHSAPSLLVWDAVELYGLAAFYSLRNVPALLHRCAGRILLRRSSDAVTKQQQAAKGLHNNVVASWAKLPKILFTVLLKIPRYITRGSGRVADCLQRKG